MTTVILRLLAPGVKYMNPFTVCSSLLLTTLIKFKTSKRANIKMQMMFLTLDLLIGQILKLSIQG